MGVILPQRAAYRVRQFAFAVLASQQPLSPAEHAQVRTLLSDRALALFAAMPRVDQRHSLKVLRALQARGLDQPELLQAALLHDCAKRAANIHLWHRVAIVLARSFLPAWMQRLNDAPAPPRRSWRYPFWAHRHHAVLGAALADEAGCPPLTVTLIRYHQESGPLDLNDPTVAGLLAIFRAIDDEN